MKENPMFSGSRILPVCILVLLFTFNSCAGIKVVHLPIPIPTFGLGSKDKDQKTVVSNEPSDREVVSTGEAEGLASWYGPKFHNKKTASGERFNMYAMTAAHRTLPFDSRVRVTNLENGKQAVVRINDRGPWVKNRIIDVSRAAARRLGFENQGVTKVKLEVLE